MKVLIDIPDNKYLFFQEKFTLDRNFRDFKIIVIPKGHGDLIDKSELNDRLAILRDDEYYSDKHYARLAICSAQTVVDELPIIIEADKEVENGDNN